MALRKEFIFSSGKQGLKPRTFAVIQDVNAAAGGRKRGDMKKRFGNKTLFLTAAILIMTFGWSMTICAEPAVMPDGTVFDAAFYAQTYPDVAAVYGNDANLLYQHYALFGRAEGRMAVAPEAVQEPPAAPVTPEVPALPDPPVAVQQATNMYRQAGGLSGLSWDETLAQSAYLRATETSVLFSHTRPNGSTCFTAIPSDYRYRMLGENIAAGYPTAEKVTEAWMNSEGHRANIMNGGFTKIGVGYYVDENGYPYWVQLFAG